jgi:predicted phage baseplate assembly protein
MPLPLPDLDQRTYDSLLEEARNLLPAIAPAWTDYNASDPGITLIELLAYLTEIGSYRLNRVTPQQRRAWLRMLGYTVAPAGIARSPLVLNAGAPVRLPRGVQVSDTTGAMVFQTTSRLVVHPATLKAVLTTHHAGQWQDHGSHLDTLGPSYAPLGDNPQPDDAWYLGFDQPLEREGSRIRLFVFGENPAADQATWQALIQEERAVRRERRAACPYGEAKAGDLWQHYGVRLAWEYYGTDGDWHAVPGLRDRTRGLSLSGAVSFPGLAKNSHACSDTLDHPDLYYLRCRLLRGAYDQAPCIRGVHINTVMAEHAADQSTVVTHGPAFGWAGDSFSLPVASPVPGRTRLEVTFPFGTREHWLEVPDWDRSGPFDSHYVVQRDTGVVSFGDGRIGRALPADALVEARYAVGAGATGNLPAGTLRHLLQTEPALPATLEVSQPVDAWGGAEPEALEHAEGRAARGLPQSRCAVTLQDYERLARQAPGLPVVRAWAVAGFHPQHAWAPAAGCVTVVIVPDGRLHAPPTEALLRSMAAWLDRRRPVATELHITGPRYTRVTVQAQFELNAGTEAGRVLAAASAALDTFFHPLHGGPESGGWPAGRDVYRSEVQSVLMAVAGVRQVNDLTLQRDDDRAARCGNIALCPDALVMSGPHHLTTG